MALANYNPVEVAVEESPKPLVKTWQTSVASIFENSEFRFDAPHYDPTVSEAKLKLKNSAYETVPLSSLADVYLRGHGV